MYARILDGDKLHSTTDAKEIAKAIGDKLPVWIELEKQSPEAEELLRDVLQVHPLTIEDIWQQRTYPKLDDYDNYPYVILHGVRDTKEGLFDLVELDVVIGSHWVVTHD